MSSRDGEERQHSTDVAVPHDSTLDPMYREMRSLSVIYVGSPTMPICYHHGNSTYTICSTYVSVGLCTTLPQWVHKRRIPSLLRGLVCFVSRLYGHRCGDGRRLYGHICGDGRRLYGHICGDGRRPYVVMGGGHICGDGRRLYGHRCGDGRRPYVVIGGGYMATYVVIGGGYMATYVVIGGYMATDVVIGGGYMATDVVMGGGYMWLWEEAICGDRRRLYVVMGGGYMATDVVIIC